MCLKLKYRMQICFIRNKSILHFANNYFSLLILAAGSRALALVVWSIPAAQLQADQATRGGTNAKNLILLLKLQVRHTARFTESTASILGFDMNINIQGVLYTCWSHFQYWRKEWKIQKSPCLTMFQEQFVNQQCRSQEGLSMRDRALWKWKCNQSKLASPICHHF